VLGSGYQDVDITLRINHQATKIIKAGCATNVQGVDLSHADVTEGVGFALPNHPSNKWDLNCEAKVKNIDPKDFQKAGGHEWSNVNQKNRQIMKAKMQTQQYTRNQIEGHTTQHLLLSMAKNVGNRWVSTLPATPKTQKSMPKRAPPPRPPPPRAAPAKDMLRHVHFYTAGLSYVGSGPLEDAPKDLGKQARHASRNHLQVSHTLLQDCMIACQIGEARDNWAFFDCRVFNDPNRKRGRNHIGLNSRVLFTLASHPKFLGFFPTSSSR